MLLFFIALSKVIALVGMIQEVTTFDHDFVVGEQCRTENAYAGHQHNTFI